MTTEVTNGAEDTTTGASPAPEQDQNTNAAAIEPVKAAAEAPEELKSSGEFDFGAILEQFEAEQTVYHSGELVSGKVVGVSDRGVLVDFGYKSEGVIPAEEIAAPGEEPLSVGDTVEVVIKSIHSGDAPPIL